MAASADCARRSHRRLAPGAIVALALVTVVWAAVPAGALPQLDSQGSSFAGIAIQQWVGQSQGELGLNVNFQITSSVLGLNAFAQNQVDFAASDIPYSSGQSSGTPTQPYQYMPDVAGALAFMYNLTGIDGQQIKNLVLNAATVCAIFTGKIEYWDDQSIKAINPPAVAENLPHQQIIPVYREDASGENYLLSDYLLHVAGAAFNAYQSAVGSPAGSPEAAWPVPQEGQSPPAGYPNVGALTGQNGSDGVANYVSALSSQGSIGYLETAYAYQHDFPVASLVNASGNAVQPLSVNDATALEKAILFADLTQNLANVYTNPLPNAYPISAYSYLVAPCNPTAAAAQQFQCTGQQTSSPMDPAKGAELGQFVSFLACAGQQKMALLGYSPLPPNLVEEDFQAVGRLNGATQPPAPTAANCQNPYVDGQVQLPGEPAINTTVADSGSSGAATVVKAAQGTTPTTTVTRSGLSTTGTTTPDGGSGPTAGRPSTYTGSDSPGGRATDLGGTSGPTGNTDGGGGTTGPDSTGSRGGSSGGTTAQTQSAADPFRRFLALQQTAADVTGPPVGDMALLWCGLLLLALAAPPLAWAWWRRRTDAAVPGAPDGGSDR